MRHTNQALVLEFTFLRNKKRVFMRVRLAHKKEVLQFKQLPGFKLINIKEIS